MSLIVLLLVSVLVDGILSLFVLGRLEKRFATLQRAGRIALSGPIAATKFAIEISQMAVIVYGSFALLALVMGMFSGNSVGLLTSAVAFAVSMKNHLRSAKSLYEGFTFAAFICAFFFLVWRQRRDALSGATRYAFDLEEDRLNIEREADPAAWDALPPNPAMLEIDAATTELQALLPPASDKEQHAARIAGLRGLELLNEKRIREDYSRRFDLARVNAVLAGPQRKSFLDLLLSKGFYGDLKLGSKLLKRTVTVLTLLSLITIGSLAGMNTVLDRKLIRLDDLRVAAGSREVRTAWDQGLASHPQPEPLTADDRAAIRYLSDQFARALLKNPSWQTHGGPASAAQEATLTREAILSETELPASPGVKQAAYQSSLTAEEQDVLHDAIPRQPQDTRLGQTLAEQEGSQVKSWFGSRWENVKAAAKEHALRYHDPLQAMDVQESALDSFFSDRISALHGHGGEGVPFPSSQAEKLVDTATKASVSEVIPTEFHRMMEDLANGKPLEEVFDHVRKIKISISDFHLRDLADVMRAAGTPAPGPMAEKLAEQPGTWTANKAAQPTPEVSDIVDRIAADDQANFHSSHVDESEVEGLAEYDDFFPKSTQAARSTVMAQELASHGESYVAGAVEDVAFRVERAGSFAMLQGFSRVGGVLIGREPEHAGQHLDLRGLDWTMQGRQVTLILRDAGGKATTLGPFDKSLVHQALAYAADGRPVAVTMTTAKPVRALKVQLHPVLVDTPLGCRVSQLDRLVDTFSGDTPEREREQISFERQLAVYEYAWGVRITPALPESSSFRAKLQASLASPARLKELDRDLAEPTLLSPAGVLQRKPEFFDASLVSAIAECRPRGAQAFASCIGSKFDVDSAMNHDKQAWFDSRATFEPWSGVRERPYEIRDLSFLQPPPPTTAANRLWPFDFLVQISFKSPAINVPGGDDAKQHYVDKDPLELTGLRPEIERNVDNGIRTANLTSSFQDLRNFVILQRLFRAALKGYLGDQFPVTHLAALQHATAGDIPYLYTARWGGSGVIRLILAGAPQAEIQSELANEKALGVQADQQKLEQQNPGARRGESPCAPLATAPQPPARKDDHASR